MWYWGVRKQGRRAVSSSLRVLRRPTHISRENQDEAFIRGLGIAMPRRDSTSGLAQEGPRLKLKVCLVGANTGCKTKLVRKHVSDQFDDKYILTLGAKVSKKQLTFTQTPSNAPIHLDLLVWDIMGDRGFRELLREAYFDGAKGIVAVSDMTRKSTVMELDDWIEDVQGVTGPIPVVVIGANHDQKDRLQVSEEEMRRLAEALKAPCFFASETSSQAVEEAFRRLADATVRSLLARQFDGQEEASDGSNSV